MANKTLLSVVQTALAVSGGDTVSSIYDSPESEDVAVVCRDVYEDMMTWDEWPHMQSLASLDSVADDNCPTALRINSNYLFIHNVEYFEEEPGRQHFVNLEYVEPEHFLQMTDGYMNLPDVVRASGYGIMGGFVTIRTDKTPEFYTSFDNKHIILDSFKKTDDSYVKSEKMRMMVSETSDFELDDEYVIDLPPNMVPLYMAEVKVAVYYYLNQQQNAMDTKRSLRQLAKLREHKKRTLNERREHYPDGQYGRRPNGSNFNKLGRR